MPLLRMPNVPIAIIEDESLAQIETLVDTEYYEVAEDDQLVLTFDEPVNIIWLYNVTGDQIRFMPTVDAEMLGNGTIYLSGLDKYVYELQTPIITGITAINISESVSVAFYITKIKTK